MEMQLTRSGRAARVTGGCELTQRTLVHRYAPFLAIVAMLGLLMVLEPEDRTTAASGDLTAGAGATVGAVDGAGGIASTGGGGADVANGNGAGTGAAAATATGSGGGGAAAGGAAAAGRTATGQPVDALGRPTEGDRCKCAPGGLLQENVTSYSLPCIPSFDG